MGKYENSPAAASDAEIPLIAAVTSSPGPTAVYQVAFILLG